MIRVVIVDDEPPARARLRLLLDEATDVIVVGEAADASAARTVISASNPDLVFLDIDMPLESGTALAASLPEPRPFLVFATAHDRFALEAFAVDATDYVVKPVSRGRLGATLARVRERLSKQSDLERELAVASRTQAALVPRQIPPMDGYDGAAETAPARGVGGDFLVAQRVSPSRVVLVLGDVSGHGLSAGLVAAHLQARIEALAGATAHDAGAVLADVNRALCAGEPGHFATLVYLDVNHATHSLSIINAGHPPVWLLDTRGQRHAITATAPALGFLSDARFASAHVDFAANSLCVAYSDGVVEACDPSGTEFGEAGLAAALVEWPSVTPSAQCQTVIQAVRRHAGGLADDVSVLALRRLPT